MAVTAGDVIKCAAKQVFSGVDDHVNVFHMQIVTPPTPNDDASLLNDLSEHISEAYSTIQAVTHNSLVATVIEMYNITDDRPIGVTSWAGPYTGGTATGDMLPPDDAILALLDTGLKRRQGRMYFSGITEGHQNGGQWDGAARSAAVNVPTVLKTIFSATFGGEFVLVVYSKADGLAYPVFTLRAQPLVADMPSRKQGRGS